MSILITIEIQEKLKAMLTQVQRGESAPRVTGAYPQGLKSSGCSTPTGMAQVHHGRNNNRYQSSSVNNPNNRMGNNVSFVHDDDLVVSHI